MVRLQSQLEYFISNKLSTDSLWQGVQVILSGHETPGEGEHKIMDYIRHQKAQPGNKIVEWCNLRQVMKSRNHIIRRGNTGMVKY